MENVPKWSASADAPSPTSPNAPGSSGNKASNEASGGSGGSGGVNGDISSLESTIHRHQSLYETMCQAYTEVHSNSKKLLYQLDHLVQVNNQTKEETKHVSDTMEPISFHTFCRLISLY